MAQTIQFTLAETQVLTAGLTKSTDIALAAQQLNLKYSSREIQSQLPPALAAPQRIKSLTINGTTYLTPQTWQPAWYAVYLANQQLGLEIVSETPITKANILVGNLTLAEAVASVASVSVTTGNTAQVGTLIAGVPGAQGADGPVGPQGATGASVYAVTVVDGRLSVSLTDGTVIDAGEVSTTLSVNTVSLGMVPSATITGVAPSQQLSFVFPNAEALGLGNVTNESKATMFANPSFTGTTNTGDVNITGTLTVNGTAPVTQSTIIALGLAF